MLRYALLVSLLVALSSSACRRAVYVLPDPVPPEEARDVSTNPAEERARDAERFVAARQAILALYDALANERWSDASALLSSETQVLLSDGGSGDPEATLAAGVLEVRGERYGFDPIELLLLPGLRSMDDAPAEGSDEESDRRKVVHLTALDGMRAVIVIREGDAWNIHLPSVPPDLVEPLRR